MDLSKMVDFTRYNEKGESIGFNSPDSSSVVFSLKLDFQVDEVYIVIDGHREKLNYSQGEYRYIFDAKARGCGLYSFHFEILLQKKLFYFSKNDLSSLSDYRGEGDFTFLVYSNEYKTPDFMKGGIIYQIFPDRFLRSGKVDFSRKDAVLYEDWDNGIPEYPEKTGSELKNNTFFGGDLYGIASKLDYLLSLGVNIIYLNPIFKAYSNHRYDTGDYERIDELLGGEEAFDYLVSECKSRGIHIILDGVFNHTGDDSRYFNKYGKYDTLGAYQSKESPYRNWYRFDKDGKNYESWWGISILPRVQCDDSGYRDYICGKNGIIKKYIAKGISGWRLDVADELSDDFIENIRKSAKKENPEAVIIGEVWEDASNKISYGIRRKYLQGNELDSVMNYPLKNAIIDYLLSSDSSVIYKTVKTLCENYPKCTLDVLMNFLGTHDTERIMNVLAGSPCGGMPNSYKAKVKLTAQERALAKKRLTLAVCLLMTLPGVPSIYYADEVGLEGYGDPFNRFPYPWSRPDTEVLGTFRRFAAARLSSDVYKDGNYECLVHEQGVFVFSRESKNQKVITAVNAGKVFYTYKLDSKCRSLLTGTIYDEDYLLLPMTCDILEVLRRD